MEEQRLALKADQRALAYQPDHVVDSHAAGSIHKGVYGAYFQSTPFATVYENEIRAIFASKFQAGSVSMNRKGANIYVGSNDRTILLDAERLAREVMEKEDKAVRLINKALAAGTPARSLPFSATEPSSGSGSALGVLNSMPPTRTALSEANILDFLRSTRGMGAILPRASGQRNTLRFVSVQDEQAAMRKRGSRVVPTKDAVELEGDRSDTY